MTVLNAWDLGKAYKQYPNRWSRVLEWCLPFLGPRHSMQWVLQNIEFQVDSGDAVGIVGINGAGKSTLLKIIAGVTQPTTGTIQVNGRVAALLELGLGFHPEFTGRQNAYTSAQLMGLPLEEVHELMPHIIDFAEIGEAIDQPLRVYSSGMHMRLAFSVATCIRPDILIVDEILSVGDAAFQRKCFRRIKSFLESGTALLFVAHDTDTIKKICQRAIFIKDGCIGEYGSAKTVCDAYERYLFGTSSTSSIETDTSQEQNHGHFDPDLQASCRQGYGDGRAIVESCWLEDIHGQSMNVIESGRPFRWCYIVRFLEQVHNPVFGMMLKNREGVALYGTDSKELEPIDQVWTAGDRVCVVFDLANHLAPGLYYLNCGVRIEDAAGRVVLARILDAAILRVSAQEKTTASFGIVELAAACTVHTIHN